MHISCASEGVHGVGKGGGRGGGACLADVAQLSLTLGTVKMPPPTPPPPPTLGNSARLWRSVHVTSDPVTKVWRRSITRTHKFAGDIHFLRLNC
ncbi:hypothetical protein ATANTOWER_027468 [Ataeniobius toweri]|uniref:Uncharacterized protein n=1 Tax=Ataeniobius toweri TaxID=208326 RepID=A0ABU7BNK8_9TELE|nr:hypothetical protein [Ataeniobius toweri]